MKKIFIFLIVLSLSILAAFPILAVALEVAYPTIGGTTPGGGPLTWVSYIFFLALLLTGIAAVGSLIYAGIIWMTSGNTERIKDAKARIRAAILGVLLVASSVVILRTINPDLVSLSAPPVENIFTEEFNHFVGNSCDVNNDQCGVQAGAATFCHPGTSRCAFKVTDGQNCRGDVWCLSDKCGEDNKCVNAASCQSGECDEGLFCSPLSRRCFEKRDEGGPCTFDGACKDGLVCKDAALGLKTCQTP